MIHSQNLARMTPFEREAFVATLSQGEADQLRYHWPFWARPEQLLPTSRPWVYWMPLAGRGWGKTRVGWNPCASGCGATACRPDRSAANTADDVTANLWSRASWASWRSARGKSGRATSANRRRCCNGRTARCRGCSRPKQPDRLRGKQHMEAMGRRARASWRYPDAWDQALLGLRLGENRRPW